VTFRLLPTLIVIAILIGIATFVADRPGSVELVWLNWRIETNVAVLLLGIIVLGMAAAALFHLLRKLLTAPSSFMRARRERRRREGYKALTQGMVAVAAGDAAEAQKFARKADVLLAEPPLTLLLSAQAAQLSGDAQAASKYFHAMLERSETEFLGLRGLLMQALHAGDEATGLRLVERAKALRPRTPWVLTNLYELQARASLWLEAETTLTEAVKRGAIPEETAKHHHAVLSHLRSIEAEAAGDAHDALALAAKAFGYHPGFTAGVARYAKLLRLQGKKRRAGKVLESAWAANPHPELAAEHHALYADETPVQRVSRIGHLTAANPDHPESRLALARAALAARLWGEARRHLHAAGASPAVLAGQAPPPAPRFSRMMAEIEEGEHGALATARSWLAHAAETPAADPTYICDACGGESQHWVPLCPHCRAFASLHWRVPRHARQRVTGATGPDPMLALPASLAPRPAPPSVRQIEADADDELGAVDAFSPRL